MALKARIQDDMKAALLGGDRFTGEVLRGLKAAILNEEVAQKARDTGLADDEIEKIIVREVKKRRESAEIYEQNGRPETAADERREAEILSRYLPRQLSEAEIADLARQVIAEIGAGPKQAGQVIGAVKRKAGSAADGGTIARVVRAELDKQS